MENHGKSSGSWLFQQSPPSSPPAATALKGPRLVSGEPGGDVTIKCRYNPTSINRLQRKYWCRLGPPMWSCHTVVSTNHYTNLRYRGRVALEDFPQCGFFVVRLSQLLPEDVGHYRCGIGNRNDMFFFSMNLTVSTGSSSIIPSATVAAEELAMRSFGTASPVVNRWIPGATQTIEGQGTGCNRAALTPRPSRMIAPTKRGQTSETTEAIGPAMGSWVEGSFRATVSTPESQTVKTGGLSKTSEGIWVWATKTSVGNRARESEGSREISTTKADRRREETRRVRIGLDGNWKVIGTIRPSTLVSEKWTWETLQEAMPVSRRQALGPIKATPAPGMWTLGITSTETASTEGSPDGDQAGAAGDGGPQATSSQALAAGPQRPLAKGSSMESSFLHLDEGKLVELGLRLSKGRRTG
ncbi:high affinity immunoglobulin alpha and immunoglobulin mu Fc receptor [Dasypus novemcinctus]|uniref:high affinity immunoglobulin alpha and immunoglobulin mu Fc receptor n=1 Tax=Dasypus novemcinctus TaxID=9361 RepID=UPI00265D897E|nr:high affinity immunoglobulin alpha and immunoglobulin mu Fc receptor [Dasypus novemcinctus]